MPGLKAKFTIWLYGAWAVFAKDAMLELRSRHAINVLVIFVLATLLLLAVAAGRIPIATHLQSALLWMVILFSTALGLGRAFVAEEEQSTALLLRLNVPSSRIYAGKLSFNLVLSLLVNSVIVAAFIVLLRVEVGAPLLLIFTVVLGSLGLAGTTTILAALVARAQRRTALLPMLMFPLLLPVLLPAVNATQSGLIGSWQDADAPLIVLFSFSGAVITVSAMLFDHAWRN